MKTHLFATRLTVLMVTFTLALASCKKDEDNSIPASPPPSTTPSGSASGWVVD